MGQPAGLSFEQAPPFAAPLRFFLTAPLFLLAAAVLIASSPDALASRWTPQAFALTHALTLGFLAMSMLGAMMQMLPVVAGASLPSPRLVSALAHVSLVAGTAALMTGFLTSDPAAFGVAVLLLGGSFIVFLGVAGTALMHAVASVTVSGMRFALAGLSITVLLGMVLALVHAGGRLPAAIQTGAGAHAAFGLLGWVLLLVIGVAYQVVPMFQITPAYPPWLSRWLVAVLFVLLLLHAATPALPDALATAIDAGLASAILVFALVTLWLQSRRRRKLPDVTLDFWRLGMASLIACVLVWLYAQFVPAWAASVAYPLSLGVLFIGGFGVSVVNGMLYKIVPFLAWFHLQAQLQARAGTIPTMKDMIAPRWARSQFLVHLVACVLVVAGLAWPQLLRAAGLALALSAVLLGINLLAAVRSFSRHGGRYR